MKENLAKIFQVQGASGEEFIHTELEKLQRPMLPQLWTDFIAR
jgi:hypothetical protein